MYKVPGVFDVLCALRIIMSDRWDADMHSLTSNKQSHNIDVFSRKSDMKSRNSLMVSAPVSSILPTMDFSSKDCTCSLRPSYNAKTVRKVNGRSRLCVPRFGARRHPKGILLTWTSRYGSPLPKDFLTLKAKGRF